MIGTAALHQALATLFDAILDRSQTEMPEYYLPSATCVLIAGPTILNALGSPTPAGWKLGVTGFCKRRAPAIGCYGCSVAAASGSLSARRLTSTIKKRPSLVPSAAIQSGPKHRSRQCSLRSIAIRFHWRPSLVIGRRLQHNLSNASDPMSGPAIHPLPFQI
jgi:hypothetical protein